MQNEVVVQLDLSLLPCILDHEPVPGMLAAVSRCRDRGSRERKQARSLELAIAAVNIGDDYVKLHHLLPVPLCC